MKIKKLGIHAILLVLIIQLSGCGTILYPERKGQSVDGARIDTQVAILDGLGLLLFIIPGVIAFAVDFTTGAIYLPPGSQANMQNSNFNTSDRIYSQRNYFQMTNLISDYHFVHVEREQLTRQNIESIVLEYTGKMIRLDDEQMQVYMQDTEGELLLVIGI